MSAPICRDCKFFQPDTRKYYTRKDALHYGRCTHSNGSYTNIVSGEVTYQLASVMRDSSYTDVCGKDAQFFEKNNDTYEKYIREVCLQDIVLFTFVVILLLFAKALLFGGR